MEYFGAHYASISDDVEQVGKIAASLAPKIHVKAFASKMAEASRLLEAGARRIG